MPATTSTTLLPTTTFGSAAGNYDGASAAFNGNKVKGDGYYGFSDGVHTVQTRVTSLVATVKIQGTLVKDPADTDWVDIASVVTTDGSTAITESYFNNFTGNFVYIRTKLVYTDGTVNSIRLNH